MYHNILYNLMIIKIFILSYTFKLDLFNNYIKFENAVR